MSAQDTAGEQDSAATPVTSRLREARTRASDGALPEDACFQLGDDLDAYLDTLADDAGAKIAAGDFQASSGSWQTVSGLCADMAGIMDLVLRRVTEDGGAHRKLAGQKDDYEQYASFARAQALIGTSLGRMMAGSLEEAETAAAEAENTFRELSITDPEAHSYMYSMSRSHRLQVTAQSRARRLRYRQAAAAYVTAGESAEDALSECSSEAMIANARNTADTCANAADRCLMRAAIDEGKFEEALAHVQAVLARPAPLPATGVPAWAAAAMAFQRNVDAAYEPYLTAEISADRMEWGEALDALGRSDGMWRQAMMAAFDVSIPQLSHMSESLQAFAFQMMTSTRRRIERERALHSRISALQAENTRLKGRDTGSPHGSEPGSGPDAAPSARRHE